MPATSPTVLVPVLTVTGLAVPSLSEASAASVLPLTCRSNRPPSLAGSICLTTLIVPVSRVLVIVQAQASPSSTGTLSGPASEELTGLLVLVSSVHSIALA